MASPRTTRPGPVVERDDGLGDREWVSDGARAGMLLLLSACDGEKTKQANKQVQTNNQIKKSIYILKKTLKNEIRAQTSKKYNKETYIPPCIGRSPVEAS